MFSYMHETFVSRLYFTISEVAQQEPLTKHQFRAVGLNDINRKKLERRH